MAVDGKQIKFTGEDSYTFEIIVDCIIDNEYIGKVNSHNVHYINADDEFGIYTTTLYDEREEHFFMSMDKAVLRQVANLADNVLAPYRADDSISCINSQIVIRQHREVVVRGYYVLRKGFTAYVPDWEEWR